MHLSDISALLSRQNGIVSRAQTAAAGISRAAVRHALESESWQQLLPGVFATFSGPVTETHRIRASLRYVPAEDGIMLLAPTDFRRRATGFVTVRRTTRMPPARLWTPRDSTYDQQRCVSGFAPRGPYRVAPTGLRCFVFRAPLLPMVGPFKTSAPWSVKLYSEARPHLPNSSTSSSTLPGQRHVIPDACWPEARLIVEVDSVQWHRYGDAPERTEQRRAMLASLGWTVYPVSPRRLRTEPTAVLAEIVAAYQAGLSR